jgi:hypothetical protein
MKYTPKSELLMELNNPKVVNCFNGHILSHNLYVSEGKLYKKLVCKSSTCRAHNDRYRELKLQKISKSGVKDGKLISYEYNYYNVKDNNDRIISISPAKLDQLTYVTPELEREPTLEDVLSQPD